MTTKQIYPLVTEVTIQRRQLRDAIAYVQKEAIRDDANTGNAALDEVQIEVVADKLWSALGGSA